MRPGRLLGQLLRQLDPLRLAARQRRRRLSELDVAEADLAQRLQLLPDLGDVLQELAGLGDGHVEHVGDAGLAVVHLQRLAVVAPAAAGLALDVDVGQEVHLDAQDAVALAGLAAPALDVERVAPRLVAARLRLGQVGEQIADVREHAGVGRRVRARRAADRRLVDVDHLVDVLQPVERRRAARAAPWRRASRCASARSSVSITSVDLPEPDTPVTQVSTPMREATRSGRAGCGRARAATVSARLPDWRRWRGTSIPLRPDRYAPVSDCVLPAMSSGVPAATMRPPCTPARGPHVDDVVGGADGLLVVLDDEHAVAEVAQPRQRLEQARVVALVQADRRLVEDVEHADQRAADLRGQPDALRLAARQRRRRAVERQVVDADVDEEGQAIARPRAGCARRSPSASATAAGP